jgi:hypothetical protein
LLEAWLEDSRSLYFDPQSVTDIFTRYDQLGQTLRSQYPALFGDLPPSRYPRIEQTTDFEGRGYVRRPSLDLLLKDIRYCIDVLSNTETVDIPAMKVTRESIFFAGQYFDALKQVREIISQAQRKIVVIDSYVDEGVLDLLTAKKPNVEVIILTRDASPAVKRTAAAFNKQYGQLSVRASEAFHDRFVIVDDQEFYHFGGSIKDVGHRGFMFSRIEEPVVIEALRNKFAQEWAGAAVVL